ncbi:FR47-like protein [Lentzea flaviverrucosa]|uniref:FR47-like protein n=1 Tax=Lentzea flaviverrucosa TaxID=200379 RepID=A0A1H9V1N8_9PSEU|nr:GNAT family N-acetyltransferase [Lentzea flaviverrucosa]RDI27599.1 FR47-like protein [Lentzea flaviverrucosa]SES15508.1 FR47-like protein [Lentzea flaviverrucosa]
MLTILEEFYDSVPRPGSRVEEHGDLVLFVQAGDGYPYYARPRFPGGQPTVAEVLKVRERQREIGVPEAFEWVHETTPGLLDVARQAGLEVLQAPLLVLDPEKLPEPHPHVRVIGTSPAEVSVVAQLAFSSPGTAPGGAGTAERDAELASATPTSTRHRHAVADLPGEGVLAVGTAQRAGDVVEIVGIGTLPAARRRGLGGAVTAELARDALERGAELVFLSAGSQEIARVYERVGFRRVATACIASA